MRLWIRLALLMALVSLIPLLLSHYRTIEISTRRAQRGAEHILQRDASELAVFVETWTRDQAEALRGWMLLYPDLARKPAAQQEALLRSIFVAVPSVISLALVDELGGAVVPPVFLTQSPADGTLVGREVGSAAGAAALVEHLPLSQAYEDARAALGEGRHGAVTVVGSAYRPPDAPRTSVPLAVTGPADPSLILGAEIALGPALDLVSEGNTPEHGVALVSMSGASLFGTSHTLVDGALLRPLLGTVSTFRYALGDGTGVRGAIAPVAGTDWNVVVAEPAWVAERAVREIRVQTLQVLGVSVVLAFLVGAVVARTVSEPVRRLRDQALAVAEGDYARRVDASGSDEIGELMAAFNHMAERLQRHVEEIGAQRGEIEAFNRELQERVDQRTRELKEAQSRLVRSGQLAAIAEVGAGLAHELNNPLTGILGLAQLLRARHPELAADAGRIEEQANRCREVVAAILRFSSGEVDPSEAPVVDLADVLREVLGLVRGPFRQRGVELDYAEPTAALRVRLDPVLGSRVIAQVLSALRAGLGEGARLAVSAERAGGEIIVDLVPDRPVAVGADDWRASGMGLWVARRMLDDLGGRLDAPSLPGGSWRLVLPEAA